MKYNAILCVLICLAVSGGSVIAREELVASEQVKQLFAHPTRQYSSGPLWVWNDRLTSEQIISTLQDLAGQHVKQVFVHPRPGLMTPYLSREWFDLWKVALKEAERLDMNVWIYDENSYPSGFAGGFVPRLMPEARGRGLSQRETDTPKWQDNTLAVFRLTEGQAENVSDAVRAGGPVTPGKYLVAEVRRAGDAAWTAGGPYVDLLYPGVTQKFLEVTLEAYRREIGDEFGKRVPGSFTDEPELQPAGGWPWTQDLPEQFEKQWGYSLIDHLASLTKDVGDWRTVRHNYFQTVLHLFIERWAKPYYEYCEKHDLEFTGHYWEHGWPGALGVPDNMAMAAWQQRPGIDTLMNQYAENTHAQFGNIRACREISSLANQLGRDRTLVELYGAGGWDLRFEDMKRIGDWLEVLGVNTLNEHLSYITLRGARKRDHPQSFSYHEPWWQDYHVMADYFTRVTAAMTQGEQINPILVLEPTSTAWMYQGHSRLNAIGDTFFSLLKALEAAQVEYDLGCENVMADHGSVQGKSLVIGERSYSSVVLPSSVENLNKATLALLKEYSEAGGTVYRVLQENTPKWPTFLDGQVSSYGESLAQGPNWKTVQARDVASMLSHSKNQDHFAIHRAAGDSGILFHHRRYLADGQILFLVNTSDSSSSSGTIESDMQGIEQWDLKTGQAIPYRFDKTASGVKTDFSLQPCESLLIFLSNQSRVSKPNPTMTSQIVAASGPTDIKRTHPNVLTLDYVTITTGGETLENVYFYQANQFAFRKNGLERNPWDSAVQFKDELIARTFPADSGFTATYRFTIEKTVPKNLAIVIERPDLYRITCNGMPVQWDKNQWWLDKAFGKMHIADQARIGENKVTIQATPFTVYHELEPAYVLGDFTLKSASQGFVISPDGPLKMTQARTVLTHSINPDQTMWLTQGIGYQGSNADRAPFVVFDLGRVTDLSAIQIWNYNEAHVRDLRSRGVRELRISVSGSDALQSLGQFSLALATGQTLPETLKVKAKAVRFVRFDILSNQQGVTYPAQGQPEDNGFVGLAEVRFVDGAGVVMEQVTIQKCSSELPSHARTANCLVNGSGLNTPMPGWNEQGHPFYSEGVAYTQVFDIGQRSGRYEVSLPNWYGSTARVTVNGKPAGSLMARPWTCDVTDLIEPGKTTIQVEVIGTLKNTLGPHHGNPGLGSAWPGMFQNGPQNGPPPGEMYHTVAYGLYEPFTLSRVW